MIRASARDAMEMYHHEQKDEWVFFGVSLSSTVAVEGLLNVHILSTHKHTRTHTLSITARGFLQTANSEDQR